MDQKLFRDNNQAYYFSSRFLPKTAREDISKLYGFLHITKTYSKNKDTRKKLIMLEKSYESAISNFAFDTITHSWDDQDVRIIKNIVHLQYKYKFEPIWIKNYFKSLKQDIGQQSFSNVDQTFKFLAGYAETVGYMFAKILNLQDEILKFVEAQSKATQWINFINHLAEDSLSGKCYFSVDELKKYGLKDLKEETIESNIENYKKFIHFQLNRYKKWQSEAIKGIKFIPERYQVGVRTAINTDQWIAKKIEKDPTIIYKKVLKPRRQRIIRQVIKNTTRGTARISVRTSKKVRAGVKNVKPITKAVVPKIKQAPNIAKEKVRDLKDKYIDTKY